MTEKVEEGLKFKDEWRIVRTYGQEEFEYSLRLVSFIVREYPYRSRFRHPLVKHAQPQPFGFSVDELKKRFDEMSEAFKKPVLTYDEQMILTEDKQ